MTTGDDKALYDYLVAEYNHHFDYWDWSYLDGRRVNIFTAPAPWDYTASVQTALREVHSVLDMHTGSGEIFAGMLKEQPVAQAYATEGYAPNLAMARQLLTPLGATVYAVQDEHLPFMDDSLELITNRHGSYDPHEVLRVLKLGGLFITQQVGDQTNRRIHELLASEKKIIFSEGAPQRLAWNLEYALIELREHGWHIVASHEHCFITRFYDTGAIVYYLKAIPWEVPDFSVARYFAKLVAIHHLIEREGYLDVPFHSFFIIARKE